MAISVCTKFDKNIFIGDRDKVKQPKSNMAAATVLNFTKV